jgi:hypothetical protein
VDPGVERVLMQALAPYPGERPTLQRVVLALERAQTRLAVVEARLSPRLSASARAWRAGAAGLGLTAFWIWRKVAEKRGRHGSLN